MDARSFPEPNPDFDDLGCPRDPRNDTRKDTESQEKHTRRHPKTQENENVFICSATGTLSFSSFFFFPILLPSGRLRDPKSSEKQCRVFQNRRVHFFSRKPISVKKMFPHASQNDPRNTPGHTKGRWVINFGGLFS